MNTGMQDRVLKGQERVDQRVRLSPRRREQPRALDTRPELASGAECEAAVFLHVGWTVCTPYVTGRAPSSAVMDAPVQ